MKKIAYINTEFLPVPPVKGGAVEGWIESVSRRLKNCRISIFSIDSDAISTSEEQGHIRYFWFKAGLISKMMMCSYKLPFKNGHSKLFYLPYSFLHRKLNVVTSRIRGEYIISG